MDCSLLCICSQIVSNHSYLYFFRSRFADDLFLSDDDKSSVQDVAISEKKKKRSKPSSSDSRSSHQPPKTTPSTSASSSSKKMKINPVSKPHLTARDLFGTDSDEEDGDTQTTAGKKPSTVLLSSITRRLATGHARQSLPTKTGTHYIELKVYRCDEIENVAPMNRWRQAVVALKNRTDEGTEAWGHLTKFMCATRKEFKSSSQTFMSSYF